MAGPTARRNWITSRIRRLGKKKKERNKSRPHGQRSNSRMLTSRVMCICYSSFSPITQLRGPTCRPRSCPTVRRPSTGVVRGPPTIRRSSASRMTVGNLAVPATLRRIAKRRRLAMRRPLPTKKGGVPPRIRQDPRTSDCRRHYVKHAR